MRNDLDSPYGAYALPSWRRRLVALAQAMPVGGFGRRAALLLRKLALLGGRRIVDAAVEGLQFRFYMDDNVGERKFLFMPQFFDRLERERLAAELRPGDTFVDVGANVGIYALGAARRLAGAGRVIAIEPNPVALARLRFNARLNDLQTAIVEAPFGVSDAAGEFDLMLDAGNLGGASLVVARSGASIRVPCLPLLALLRRLGVERIAALKIDIEGAEDKALLPFFRDAPRSLYPALLILEKSPQLWRADLPAALRDAGYRPVATTRMNLVWRLGPADGSGHTPAQDESYPRGADGRPSDPPALDRQPRKEQAP